MRVEGAGIPHIERISSPARIKTAIIPHKARTNVIRLSVCLSHRVLVRISKNLKRKCIARTP